MANKVKISDSISTIDSAIAASSTAIKTVNDYLNSHINSTQAHNAANIIETVEKQFVSAAEKDIWNSSSSNIDILYCQQHDTSSYSALQYTLPTTYRYFKVILSRFKINSGGSLCGKFTETTNNWFYGLAMAPLSDLTVEIGYWKTNNVFQMLAYDSYSSVEAVIDMARVTSNKIVGTVILSSDGGEVDEGCSFCMGNFSAITTPKTFQLYATDKFGNSSTIKNGSVVILGVK